MKRKQTVKQRKFFRELVRTLEPTESAMRVYNCKDRNSAKVIASKLLTKFNVSMPELMDKMGLDTESDLKLLSELRSANVTKVVSYEGTITDTVELEDNSTRLKALELTLKLKGQLKSDGLNVNVNVDNSKHHSQVLVFGDSDEDIDGIYDSGKDNETKVHAPKGTAGNRCKEKI